MKRTESGLHKPSHRLEFPSALAVVMKEVPLVQFSLMRACKGLELYGNATLSNWVNSRSTENQKEKIHTLRVVFRKFEALRIPFAEYEAIKNRLFTPDEFELRKLQFFDRFEDGTQKDTSFCYSERFVYAAPESVFTVATWECDVPFLFMKKCGVKEEELVSYFSKENLSHIIELEKEEIVYGLAAQGYSPKLIANLSRILKLGKKKPTSPRYGFSNTVEISSELVENKDAYQRILPHFKRYYSKYLSKLSQLNLHAEHVSSLILFNDFVSIYEKQGKLIPPEVLDKMVPQDLFAVVGKVPSSIEHALPLFIELFCYRQSFCDLNAKERVECFYKLFGMNAPRIACSVIRKTKDVSIIVSYTLWNFKLQASRPRFMGRELLLCMDRVHKVQAGELLLNTLKEVCNKGELVLFYAKTHKHVVLSRTRYHDLIQ